MGNPAEKPIYGATVDHVAQLRHKEADVTFPVLERKDFKSDAAYKEALVKQYQAMRQQEFQYVVTDEATKAYMVATEANCRTKSRCHNKESWDGYPKNQNQTLVRDSAFHRTKDIAEKSDGHVVGANCCAISSTSLVAQISGEMGYDGEQNLIQPRSRYIPLSNGKKTVGPNNNPGAASCINRLDSIPKNYRLTPENIPSGTTLNSAIKDGLVKAGDEVAIVTNPSNSDPNKTGCHAMVVVDIQKNENGQVTSYTLQCNNPPCLKHIDAKNPDYYASKPLKCAVKFNDWINDKIKQEATTGMTTQQLQAKVAAERKKLNGTIDDLQKTENILASHKEYMTTHDYNKFDGYCTYYNTLETKIDHNIAAQQIPQFEEANRKREQELAQREAKLKQREAKYQADLLAFDPSAANCPVEETPAASQQTPTPRKNKSKMSLEERANAVNAKTEELNRKEQELADREHELSMKENDLAMAKAKAKAPLEQSSATEKPKKDNKKKEPKPQASETQSTPAPEATTPRPTIPETEEPTMVPLSQQLQTQTGELQQSSFAEIKSGPMYKETEKRIQQQQLQKTDNQRTTATPVLFIDQNGNSSIEMIEQQPTTTDNKPKEISLSQLQRAIDSKRSR